MSRVRDLGETICKTSKHALVNKDRAYKVAEALKDFKLELPRWDFSGLYPQVDDFEEMCQFYLVFNSINYCYFDDDGEKFTDGNLRGSTLASKRLTDLWEELQNPLFLSYIDENFLLGELFAAEVPISLVRERVSALREVGNFLNSNSDFTFEKLFKKYKKNAYLVSQALPTLLPTWSDPFYKRAQLFVGMVYGRFQD